MKNKNKITLRQAGPQDVHALLELKSEASNVYWSGHARAPDRKIFQAWFEKLPTSREVLLAECDSKVVGYLYIDTVDEQRSKEVSIGVGEKFTGKSFGAMMLGTALSHVAPNGLHAWIFVDNSKSIRVFSKAGFERDDTVSPRLVSRHDKADGVEQFLWRRLGRAQDSDDHCGR